MWRSANFTRIQIDAVFFLIVTFPKLNLFYNFSLHPKFQISFYLNSYPNYIQTVICHDRVNNIPFDFYVRKFWSSTASLSNISNVIIITRYFIHYIFYEKKWAKDLSVFWWNKTIYSEERQFWNNTVNYCYMSKFFWDQLWTESWTITFFFF